MAQGVLYSCSTVFMCANYCMVTGALQIVVVIEVIIDHMMVGLETGETTTIVDIAEVSRPSHCI